MTLRREDWRLSPPERIAPLLEAEARRWRSRLGWDLRTSWAPVEPARAAGRLPGLLTCDAAGGVRGWTFFLMHGGVLQVAALVADTSEATGALVAGVEACAQAAGAASVMCFAPDAQAPGVAGVLAARGFETEVYPYLRASAGVAAGAPAGRGAAAPLRAWQAGDARRVAQLCERAYRTAGDLRPFAPNGLPDEWEEYVTQLVTTLGCGRFLPEATVIAADGSGSLVGAVMTTRLDDKTAHLAQVVVDPEAQGRGIGRQMVTAACAAARSKGYADVTLLVARGNRAAMALYTSLGFSTSASFLAGSRSMLAHRQVVHHEDRERRERVR